MIFFKSTKGHINIRQGKHKGKTLGRTESDKPQDELKCIDSQKNKKTEIHEGLYARQLTLFCARSAMAVIKHEGTDAPKYITNKKSRGISVIDRLQRYF